MLGDKLNEWTSAYLESNGKVMKEDNYNNLIYDIYRLYDSDKYGSDKYYEITGLSKSYMKALVNSTYGLWSVKESVQERRSNKIKTILNGTK